MGAVAITAALVAEATGGRLVAGSADAVFGGVSTDTRTIGDGALFVALRGDRFDGHDYIGQAIARGARGVLASAPVAPSDAAGAVVVQVSDTLTALQALAREIRRRSGATVIAITGSAGKTSTKEITADFLAAKYRVFRNLGNLNNHIGLPLSLTELARGPEMAVVELGMNHAGEIRTLIGIAEPDVRVWTNVGDAHIGYFGSREAVALAKAEILESATPKTLIVANADDPLVMRHVTGATGRVVTFGVDQPATLRASDVEDSGFDGVSATLRAGQVEFRLTLGLPGRAHLMNVLAGAAVALEYGVPASAIAERAAAARPVARRGRMTLLASGARLVDDSYNASPAAVRLMLATLAATPVTGRRIAVIGEMRELGDAAEALHAEVGRAAAESGVDVLVAVGGPAADGLVRGAVAHGLPASRTRRFADAESACQPMRALVSAGDVILVKGSRGTRTDRIVDALAAEGQG